MSKAGRARSKTKPSASPEELTVLTIGHSTLPLDDFVQRLRSNDVTQLVDVRTVPRSRHNPQFNADALPASLAKAGIAYVHLRELGGLRHARRDSVNQGWHNTSFRGYADYMQTPDFVSAVEHLIELARRSRTAIMCAEAVPWRCHRSLIADALTVRGIRVEDIMSGRRRPVHRLTPFAKVKGFQITYPAPRSKRGRAPSAPAKLK